jgi:hypothetical protein
MKNVTRNTGFQEYNSPSPALMRLAAVLIIVLVIMTAFQGVQTHIVQAADQPVYCLVGIQALGGKGSGEQCILLPRNDYENLLRYLAGFQNRLNTSNATVAEAFKEAVIELDRYGLLPEDMTPIQAQRLVLGGELLDDRTPQVTLMERFGGNAFCYVNGQAENHMYFRGLANSVVNRLAFPIMRLLGSFVVPVILYLMLIWYTQFSLEHDFPPENALSTVYFGRYYHNKIEHRQELDPSNGSVWTSGRLGVKTWNGSLWGNLAWPKTLLLAAGVGEYYYYPGIVGFVGLRIRLNSTIHYFGYALAVNLNDAPRS